MERTPYWLIDGGVVLDVLALPAIALFSYGIYRHWRKLQTGTVNFRLSWKTIQPILTRRRLVNFLLNGVLGARVYCKPFTGLFHGCIFWGMVLLLIGTAMVLLNVLTGAAVMSGAVYTWFMAFTLDAAGLGVFIGVMFLVARRLIRYPRLTKPKARTGFLAAELLLLTVIVTGFLLEAMRIDLTEARETAFVGQITAQWLGSLFNGQSSYIVFWWLHGILSLALVAYIPFSPLTHMLFIPVNSALADTNIGAGETALDLVTLEEDPASEHGDSQALPVLGTPTLSDYQPKQLFDFTTCLWCGRCQEVCPATLTEKSLSPKGVMVTLAEMFRDGKMNEDGLIDTVGMETLFECRTCGACAEACPAMVNPLKAIWGMRQNLMMERGEMPPQMRQAYRNMEALMHPFSSSASPSDWRRGLEVPMFQAGETEYLLWIGCAVTYEDRAQKVGRAFVNILNAAGVSYGIIEEARCTGDPAKQMGDDYLFSIMAEANMQLFSSNGVRKIITLCPHCYNSFTKYYPPLGGHYEVIPHASVIRDLISAGKLELDSDGRTIAYHDPCYMGRHNRMFNEPRDVIESMGILSELPNHHGNSFCCGAGGGNYWNEEQGRRINYTRAREAFDSGAEKLASSCPFCLLMLTDGMKMYTEKTMVFDIAELVEEKLRIRT
jgi:Fe-S oxidoreductase/nitrate reductase gamma subunit